MAAYLNVVGHSEAIAWLRQIPDNSIDSCVCDSPYWLGKAPDPVVVMRAWSQGQDFEAHGAGFMGADWDAFVPQPSLWREVSRVVKPGGYVLSFFGTRTYDWGVMSMRFAALDVLDQLDWLYASGFNKSLDVSKALDALLTSGRSDSKGLKHANDEVRTGEGRQRASTRNNGIMGDDLGARTIRDEAATPEGARWQGWGTALRPAHEPIVLARCPSERTFAENVLAHEVGALNLGSTKFGGRLPSNVLLDAEAAEELGDVKRYFYCSKPANEEKWRWCRTCLVVFQAGTDHAEDHDVVVHPTQKPVSLMEYLIKLVTPPGGVVLDPFCGTGTTAVAAKRAGFNFVTCDLDSDYVKIAQTRIAAATVSADTRSSLGAGAQMCPYCKAKGAITLVDSATVGRSKDTGRKITCVTCLKRFQAEELV